MVPIFWATLYSTVNCCDRDSFSRERNCCVNCDAVLVLLITVQRFLTLHQNFLANRLFTTTMFVQRTPARSVTLFICHIHAASFTVHCLYRFDWAMERHLTSKNRTSCLVSEDIRNLFFVCKRSSGWIRYDNHIHITQPSAKYMYLIATFCSSGIWSCDIDDDRVTKIRMD